MDRSPLLRAREISKMYPGRPKPALSPVSLVVHPGELIAVVGHNGAGKSTLFEVLGGLLRPTTGSIERSVDPGEIGWCPQREIIDWSLTVQQNITLGVEMRRAVQCTELRRDLDELATALHLTEYVTRTAETLSGGELRRTQIARALIGKPRLMILDEPTTGLDPAGIRIVFEYLERRRTEGASALISTHETSRFASFCTRVIALKGGLIVADEPVADFVRRSSGSDDLWDAYEALCGAA
ncbi:ABC transporter ATP-binding protein [Leifsonia sp. ZF2019]|uniref:ABC transporter ATP-binding protein n=1 Tax=Leifsonia sp. ZF2019 TaxID=2781978 RepID=UPI001CC13292|nr:ABC transporter ATP-binding protein [Leifsonia sp. ZF2019]UAJ78003.1 ABC transporter ATP-binding protein [Leifsonia sp. ZF2019]